MGVVTTHGDFQNANILQTNSDICIIDWETAAVRSQLYDLVTLSSSIRLSQNRFKTWVATAEHWISDPCLVPKLLVPIDGRISLFAHLLIWWLEECIFQYENSSTSFSCNTSLVDSYIIPEFELVNQFFQSNF